MKEAFRKAITPSCFVALMGIPFAFVGGIVFFVLGLLIFTLIFYFYGKIVPKKYLSKDDTIEMCKKYLEETIKQINMSLPKKAGILTLKEIHQNKTDNTLTFDYDYNSTHGITEIVSELNNLLRKTLSNRDLEDNKIYIACVYANINFLAKIKYATSDGNYYNVTMSSKEMKDILSSWHSFDSEYSWL